MAITQAPATNNDPMHALIKNLVEDPAKRFVPEKPVSDERANRYVPYPPPLLKSHSDTQSGAQYRARLAEGATATLGHHVDPADIPAGHVRAFEIADGDPHDNTSRLGKTNVAHITRDGGSLLSISALLNPAGVLNHGSQGRTLRTLSTRGLPVIRMRDVDEIGMPYAELSGASHLTKMNRASASELGFEADVIRDTKDLGDLLSILQHGIFEPITVLPVTYRTPDGTTMVLLTAVDGNRRLAILRRCIAIALDIPVRQLDKVISMVESRPGGPSLFELDRDAINEVRTFLHFGDVKREAKFPKSNDPAVVADFIDTQMSDPRNWEMRTLLRSVAGVPARLILGLVSATAPEDVTESAAPIVTAVTRVVRSLHRAQDAARQWDEDAQEWEPIVDLAGQLEQMAASGLDYMPMDGDDAVAIQEASHRSFGAVDGDDRTHVIRSVARFAATIICEGTDAEPFVRDTIVRRDTDRSDSLHKRAAAAATGAMVLLGISDDNPSKYNRIRGALERVFRAPAFVSVSQHPDGTVDPWWGHLEDTVDDLVAGVQKERDEIDALSETEYAARFLETGSGHVGVYGPCQRAAAFIAAVNQCAGLLNQGAGSANPYGLTTNGLGGSRGVTTTTPNQVVLRLLNRQGPNADSRAGHELGFDQLTAMVRAALSQRPVLTPNVVDPDAMWKGAIETKGHLTEAFLRSEVFGWTAADNSVDDIDDPDDVELDPDDALRAARNHIEGLIANLHDAIEDLRTGPAGAIVNMDGITFANPETFSNLDTVHGDIQFWVRVADRQAS